VRWQAGTWIASAIAAVVNGAAAFRLAPVVWTSLACGALAFATFRPWGGVLVACVPDADFVGDFSERSAE